MKKSTLKVLAVLAMCSLLFVSTASATGTESTDDPYTDTDTFSMTIEGSINQDGYVDLSWNMYEGGDLKWYKVVHSQTNMDAKYPMDGYVTAISNPAETTYTHTGVKAGTNYYRVCAINELNLRACSNTLTFEVAEAPEETTEPVVEKDPVSNDPYTDDPAIEMTLTGVLNSLGKAELNWNEYDGGDLKWYKVVHSQTNTDAKYPVDGYVGVLSSASETSYTHTSVSEGTNYYRVCVITTDNRRGCSNTLTLQKGESAGVDFTDMEGHWAKTYVDDLASDGVVEGKDGYFEPNKAVVRAEAIKMIMIGLGFDEVTCDSTIFPDLGSGDWYCGIVTKAYKKGVVKGDDGMLYPGRNINRAEAVKILLMVKGVTPPELDFKPFPDVDYGQWFAGYAYKANILGYVDGVNGNFEPDRDITRGELAKIVSLASN
ncbi:S-layer homology domain-containing protein [Patescibacteria group bacterium]